MPLAVNWWVVPLVTVDAPIATPTEAGVRATVNGTVLVVVRLPSLIVTRKLYVPALVKVAVVFFAAAAALLAADNQ